MSDRDGTVASSSDSSKLSRVIPNDPDNIVSNHADSSPLMKRKASNPSNPSSKKSKSEKTPGSASTESPFNEIVWVKIGEGDDIPFAMHRSKLYKESSFFRNALGTHGTEAESGQEWHVTTEGGSAMLHLPHEDIGVFKRFYHYIYEQGDILQPDKKLTALTWAHVFDIYIFAIRFEIHGLQNVAVDISIEMQDRHQTLPGPHEINRLYKANIKAANFRQLFIDLFVYSPNLQAEMYKHTGFHARFLCALVIRLHQVQIKMQEGKEGKKGKKWSPSLELARERYYAHGEGNPMCLD